MTKYWIARVDGPRLRLFTGRYSTRGPIPVPVSTGNPDAARSYGDTVIAKFVCAFLNTTADPRSASWAVLPVPEARK